MSKLVVSYVKRMLCIAIVLIAFPHCAPPEDVTPTEFSASSAVMLSPASTVKWFFPEGGSTPGGIPDYHHFQTFYHFANTNNALVTVIAHFQGEAGEWDQSFQLQPNTRTTFEFTQLTGRSGFHSAEFYSNTGPEIQVASTMVNDGFDGPFWSASKAVNGSSEVRTTWSFGEGGAYAWTDPAHPVFDNWFLVYNPNGADIDVWGSFHAEDVDPRPAINHPTMRVGRRSRLAFKPFSSFAEGSNAQVRSAHIHCSQPCVAQLIMHQRREIGTRQTNTQSALGSAASEQKKTWYFVGVPTSANWHPRLYFFNVTNAWNLLKLTYRSGAGTQIGGVHDVWVPPGLRHSYDIRNELAAWNPGALDRDGDLSLQIDASSPMVVNKILYWPFGGHRWSEGATTTGHSAGGTRVVFPGGTVGGGWSNYIQLRNVSSTATNVWATVYREHPHAPFVHFVGNVPAHAMRQLDASAYGFQGNFATKLETDGGKIIAESSTYLHFTGGPQLWHTGDAVEGIVYDPGVGPYPIQP
jgi:hypothetical protein